MSPTMLDSRFFKRIATRTHDGFMYEAYEAVYARSTMVLFSRKTKTPLAALTLKAEDVGCLSMLTGRPSPQGAPEPYFQGMLNMSDQVFNFTISNLSDKGLINFNILHTPHRVSCVDPGPAYGINKVNELHKNQSYIIEADQRNSCKMILKGKTQRIMDSLTGQEMEVALTVRESETKEEKPTGLYFYLSVVPDRFCQELIEKFSEGTIWKVVPGFVRRVIAPIPSPSFTPMQNRSFLQGSASIGTVEAEALFFPPSSSWAEFSNDDFFGGGADGFFGGSAAQSSQSPPISSASRKVRFCSVKERMTSAFSLSSRRGAAVATSSLNQKRDEDDKSHNNHNSKNTSDKRKSSSSNVHDSNKNSSNSNNNKKKKEELGYVVPVEVGSTQAAELQYGSHVNVAIGYTGHDYAYDHCSEPTVLCMSIWTDMKFLALPKDSSMETELNQEIEEWIKNKGQELMESLNAIYKSETCVIDLESEADTIICTCGHQCIHHANVGNNLRRCPLCRSPITAFVKADGIMVE